MCTLKAAIEFQNLQNFKFCNGFSAIRGRLLNERISRLFFERVLTLAEWKKLLSDEHFSVDGMRIQARASHKSFVEKTARPSPRKMAVGNP